MSAWRKDFTAFIEGSQEIIFDLIADMPKYGRWLPGSQAFGGTMQVSPYPVRLGTTYLDTGPAGQRPGSVTEYDPPKYIAFHHTMALKLGPFVGNADIHIRYTLESAGRATRVIRALDMMLQAPRLLRPLIIYAFRKENVRILAELKRYVEALPKQPAQRQRPPRVYRALEFPTTIEPKRHSVQGAGEIGPREAAERARGGRPMSIYEATIPVFEQLLNSLSAIIDKAKAHVESRKIDPAALTSARLRPDMFHFVKQVQVACDWAKNVGARLAGVEPPKFDDNETTFDELKARIAKTLDYLRSLNRQDIEASAERMVVFPMRNDKMKMKGSDYAFHLALPNFYFHVTTAYDILRHSGVEIGKRDFVGIPPGISPA